MSLRMSVLILNEKISRDAEGSYLRAGRVPARALFSWPNGLRRTVMSIKMEVHTGKLADSIRFSRADLGQRDRKSRRTMPARRYDASYAPCSHAIHF